MGAKMTCPSCGRAGFDLRAYESMIVVAPDAALFTVRCGCGARVSCLREIPHDMIGDVRRAASEVGAGMGCGR